MKKANLNLNMKTMTKKARKALAVSAAFLMAMIAVSNENTVTALAAAPSIVYQAHASGIGWLGDVINGALAGTTGQSRAIECVTVEVRDTGMSGGIRYKVHMADKGWSDWVYDDRPCGTTGEGRQLEAIEMELYGDVANAYKLEYRSHCQNVGWTSWTNSGVSGTTGQGLRMEGFEAKLVKKSGGGSSGSGSGSRIDMSNALYGGAGGRLTCGFDGYSSTSGRHEGIDFAKGRDSEVRSLVSGVITSVKEGSDGTKGLSTIAIYCPDTNKTVVYLHTNPNDGLKENQTVQKGQVIAKEANRGATADHTHVEVRDGKCYGAAKSLNDPTLDNSNPTSFWNGQGYNVR